MKELQGSAGRKRLKKTITMRCVVFALMLSLPLVLPTKDPACPVVFGLLVTVTGTGIIVIFVNV